DEWLVECRPVRVGRPPPRKSGRVRTEDVIAGHQMPVVEVLDRLDVGPQGRHVGAEFPRWEACSYLHFASSTSSGSKLGWAAGYTSPAGRLRPASDRRHTRQQPIGRLPAFDDGSLGKG